MGKRKKKKKTNNNTGTFQENGWEMGTKGMEGHKHTDGRTGKRRYRKNKMKGQGRKSQLHARKDG